MFILLQCLNVFIILCNSGIFNTSYEIRKTAKEAVYHALFFVDMAWNLTPLAQFRRSTRTSRLVPLPAAIPSSDERMPAGSGTSLEVREFHMHAIVAI